MATIRNTLETQFTTKGAQRAVKETEQIGKAQTRLGQGSASAGRSFSAQSQGLGGLVGIYAAAAANVFAISAAFEALNAAAQFDTIIRGTESLAAAVGTSATQVISSLKDITAGQLSIVEASRNANLALSAGFNVDQIEQLGAVAIKASRALGRDLGDSFQRLARGAIKLEPELLDELGIFTRIEPAVNAYALSVGKSAAQLTQFERRQAFANQVIKDGTEAFKDIDTSVIGTQETFEKLVANFSDLAIIVGSVVAEQLVPLAEFLDKNLGNRILLLGSIGLIVFNSLRVALVGLATAGIASLSTSLAGLSVQFGGARKSASELANEASDISDQFKGQGAFVGGNASEGAALKKSLASGALSTREAVRLQGRIPKLLEEEVAYRERIAKRIQKDNSFKETGARLTQQSLNRGLAIEATEKMINVQLAKSNMLTRGFAKSLNVAALAARGLGAALSFGLKLLNAFGIAFVVLQGLGSIIGFDVFEKLQQAYDFFFKAGKDFAKGQELVKRSVDSSTAALKKYVDAAREGGFIESPATEDPAALMKEYQGANFKAFSSDVGDAAGRSLQTQIFDKEAEIENILAINEEYRKIRLSLEAQMAKAQKRSTDVSTKYTKSKLLELESAAIASEGKIQNERTRLRAKQQTEFGGLEKFNKAVEAEQFKVGSGLDTPATDIKNRLEELGNAATDARVKYKLFKEQFDKKDQNLTASNLILRELKLTITGMSAAIDAEFGAGSLTSRIFGMSSDEFETEISGASNSLVALRTEFKALTDIINAVEDPKIIDQLVGDMSRFLDTDNIALADVDFFQPKLIRDANNQIRALRIEYKGFSKDIVLSAKTGMVPDGSKQSVQDMTGGIKMLTELMEALTAGTINNQTATKKLMGIRKNLEATTGKGFFEGDPGQEADGFALALSKVEERAQVVVNEFNNMNALADKLAKKFQKAAAAFDDLFTSGTVNAITGDIAKNQEEVLLNEAKNLVLLRQKMNLLKSQRDMTGTIAEIERALTAAAKASFVNQVKRVPLVEKELKAVEKMERTARARLALEQAKGRELARNIAIQEKEAKLQADMRRGVQLEFDTGYKRSSFGKAKSPDIFGKQDISTIRGASSPLDSRLMSKRKSFSAESIETMGAALEQAGVEVGNLMERFIMGSDAIEVTKALNEQINAISTNAAQARNNVSEMNKLGFKIDATKRAGAAIDREAAAAGAQGASAARVAKAESDTAKILSRTILKREDILRVELALEKTKMQEAKRSIGAQAALAKGVAEDEKAAIVEKRKLINEEYRNTISDLGDRRELLRQQNEIRIAEFELAQLERIQQKDILKQQKENIDKKAKDDRAAALAQYTERRHAINLQKDKTNLLRMTIQHDKQVISDNATLLVAEGKMKSEEMAGLLTQQTTFTDPSDDLLTGVKEMMKSYSRMHNTNLAQFREEESQINASATAEKSKFDSQIAAIEDLIVKERTIEEIRSAIQSRALIALDAEQTKAYQVRALKILGLTEEEKNIDKTLRKTLANYGMESAAAEKLFKDKMEDLAYELSARKKLKELILGITDDINGGLSNAIQKLFENAATRGASLTDGIKEIGLGMYEDIRKTIVSQTIVTPAQDMMKGFIGDITGFDLNKKGIDSVQLTADGSVPVTIKSGEDPIQKVKKDIEEKGMGFFEGFKEKAKGAFDKITTSLGDFGSKAMETFRGLGSGIKNLFTGESGILSGLGGMFKGLMGSEGGGGLFSSITGMLGMGAGGGGFNFGSLFGMAAGAPMATGGLVGVRHMAEGGQINALRDRVPAMLEPGEFVIRKPAAKSIGNRALGQMNATGAAGMGNVQFNIVNEGEPKSAEQQGQPKFDADKIVIDVVMRDLQSNGPIRNALRSG